MRKIIVMLSCLLIFITPLSVYATEEKSDNGVSITVVIPETATPKMEMSPPPPKQYLYPVGVYESNEGGRREVLKVYELGENETPENISRESFEREGFLYELTDIVKKETASYNSKEHTETVTINTDTKDLDTIVKLLAPTKEFKTEDGFIGILSLDITSIQVETAGTKKSNYSVTAKREYPHLSSNDPSLLPRTITEGGRTLNLSDVSWQTQRAETLDYSELPTSYTAIVTYTTTASKTTVTGYTTTALYKGNLSKVSSGKTQYTAYFLGVPIVSPIVDKETVETTETITTVEERSILSGKPVISKEINEDNLLQNPSVFDSNSHIPSEIKEISSNTETKEIIEKQVNTLPKQTAESKPANNLTSPIIIGIIFVVIVLAGFVYIYFYKKKGGIPIMKKFYSLLCVLVLSASVATNVFAKNYSFESGANSSETFGNATSTDNPVPQNPETINVRRNKDAAYNPPKYGVFSGNIPTHPSSPYHDNSKPYSGLTGNTFPSGYGAGTASDIYSSGGNVSSATGNYGVGSTSSDIDGVLPSTSIYTPEVTNTLPSFYEDGSIGNLSIPKLKLSVRVFEGETLDNMKKGIGHFEYTSVWDGVVGFAGHNRGASDYFNGVKNLVIGDKLTYTTKYGTRTYEIFSKEKVNESDSSSLSWSSENIAVLITCVENEPSLRWCVMAREVN